MIYAYVNDYGRCFSGNADSMSVFLMITSICLYVIFQLGVIDESAKLDSCQYTVLKILHNLSY